MTAQVARRSWWEAFCGDCRWSGEFDTKAHALDAAATHNANYHAAGTDAP